MSSPHHDGSSALWAGGKEPASAQRLHKYCIGPSKWANALAGLYHSDATCCRDHTGRLVDIRSPTQEPSARLPPRHCQISSFWTGGVHPLLPSSRRCTNLELRRETHRLRSGLATVAPTLGLSRWMGGRSGAVRSHLTVYLQVLSTAQLWVTADAKSLRNKTQRPCQLPSKSSLQWTRLQCLHSNQGTSSVCREPAIRFTASIIYCKTWHLVYDTY